MILKSLERSCSKWPVTNIPNWQPHLMTRFWQRTLSLDFEVDFHFVETTSPSSLQPSRLLTSFFSPSLLLVPREYPSGKGRVSFRSLESSFTRPNHIGRPLLFSISHYERDLTGLYLRGSVHRGKAHWQRLTIHCVEENDILDHGIHTNREKFLNGF